MSSWLFFTVWEIYLYSLLLKKSKRQKWTTWSSRQELITSKLLSKLILWYILLVKKQAKKVTMRDVFGNPRYRGKHVILAAGKVFTAKTGDGASEILRTIRKKYPGVTPQVAYLPKAHSLILWM